MSCSHGDALCGADHGDSALRPNASTKRDTEGECSGPSVEVVERDGMSERLVEMIHARGAEAVRARGAFRLVLSGGSVADLLARPSFTDRVDVPYEAWTVLLSDERCVPTASADSTWGCMQRSFGAGSALIRRAAFVAPCDGDGSAAAAAARYAAYAAPLEGAGFDLVVLGVGPDGHSASLFPPVQPLGAERETRVVVPVHDSPKPPPERISMSLAVLVRARTTVVVAAGAAKAPVVAQIVRARDASFPTAHLRADRTHWLLDVDAAQMLA